MALTIAEMHNEFKLLFDKIDSAFNPNIEPEEIDVFLNRAQDELIEELTLTGLEKTQDAKDYLQDLIANYSTATFIAAGTDNKPNAKFVVLPSDYRKAIQEEVTLSFTDCNGDIQAQITDVFPIGHGEYNTAKRNPFKKPSKERVLRLSTYKSGTQQTFELVYAPGTIISNYYLRYYRNPVTMGRFSLYPVAGTDVDCEITSIEAQRIIIDKAVTMASKAVEAFQKYQIEQISNNIIPKN